jgi:hypothetical protein
LSLRVLALTDRTGIYPIEMGDSDSFWSLLDNFQDCITDFAIQIELRVDHQTALALLLGLT